MMLYLQLFVSFLKIGLFSFGGGYAALPLIQDQIVARHGWLAMEEFVDLITISQMTPGPIAINAATFVGIKIGGPFGALTATAGCILPSCVIVTVIARLYLKYRDMAILHSILETLRPAVVAMIASAGISVLASAFQASDAGPELYGLNPGMILIFAVCFLCLRKTRLSPIIVMLSAGILKLIFSGLGL